MKHGHICILGSLLLVTACSTTPTNSLQPEDVPGLYTEPAAEDQVAAAAGDAAAQAHSGLDEQQDELQKAMTQPEPSSKELQAESVVQAVEASSITDTAIASKFDNGNSVTDTCSAIAAEIEAIDAGLGSAALETPPVTPPSTMQKTGRYVYELVVQTVIGPFQPIIQTKRAIFDDNEKERRSAEALSRGSTRRAYLLGYASASGCADDA